MQTRSKTLHYFISDAALILETAKDLLYQETLSNSVRLLGISMSHLNTETKKETEQKHISVQLKFEF
jgi:DNA polymerase-4